MNDNSSIDTEYKDIFVFDGIEQDRKEKPLKDLLKNAQSPNEALEVIQTFNRVWNTVGEAIKGTNWEGYIKAAVSDRELTKDELIEIKDTLSPGTENGIAETVIMQIVID